MTWVDRFGVFVFFKGGLYCEYCGNGRNSEHPLINTDSHT